MGSPELESELGRGDLNLLLNVEARFFPVLKSLK